MVQSKPPGLLIAAFVEVEKLEDAAVLTSDEGFDADTMRVLAAWEKTRHTWTRPRKRCPGSEANVDTWEWLTSGWEPDITAIADAASVSYAMARTAIAVLVGNRLIYPDGTMNEFARNSLRAHMAKRIAGKGRRKAQAQPSSGGTN